MKLICTFVILITLSLLTTNIISQQSISATQYQPTSGGNIFYLDKHNVKCNAQNSGSALSYFYMDRQKNSSDKMRYEFSCLQSHSIAMSLDAKEHHTTWGPVGNNHSASVNYLDRHHVNCPEGQVLRDFHLQRKSNDIRYGYHCVHANTLCCKTETLKKHPMGDKTLFYLDRQPVGTLSSTKFAIKGFVLRTSYNPEEMWYTYEKCQIEDFDAKHDLEDVKGRLVTAKSELQALELELQAAQGKREELARNVANTESNLQNARNAEGLKNDC